ncbi:chemotaxis protein CheD [Aminiphilus sp.]|uniref:chemotaxis protein CheD n=1 Tax=Aminiphilus sp. TaxID=1872488 RepID=UPI002625ACBA|nr:chemotaxis protein CheD [Aminiphilus sp.]
MAKIKVGIAELAVARFPDSVTTLGLGSCVGVAIYDETKRIAGLVHIMLPAMDLAKGTEFNRAKFADSGIPQLLEMMLRAGALGRRLTAKIAGGAQMFTFSDKTDSVRIGSRNVEACRRTLQNLRIPLLAEDTGGSFGRTVEIFSETGLYEIRAVGKDRKII